MESGKRLRHKRWCWNKSGQWHCILLPLVPFVSLLFFTCCNLLSTMMILLLLNCWIDQQTEAEDDLQRANSGNHFHVIDPTAGTDLHVQFIIHVNSLCLEPETCFLKAILSRNHSHIEWYKILKNGIVVADAGYSLLYKSMRERRCVTNGPISCTCTLFLALPFWSLSNDTFKESRSQLTQQKKPGLIKWSV